VEVEEEWKPDWQKSGSPVEVHPSAVHGRSYGGSQWKPVEVQRKLVGSAGDGGSQATVQAKRVAPEGPLTELVIGNVKVIDEFGIRNRQDGGLCGRGGSSWISGETSIGNRS